MKFDFFDYFLRKNFTNKKILIFGASKGLGKAISTFLMNADAEIYIITSNSEVAKNISITKNVKILCVIENEWKTKLEEKIDDLKIKFDYVFFNSGIPQKLKFEVLNTSEIREIFDVNVLNFITLIQILTNKNLLNKRSKIVCISSGTSLLPSPLNAVYASSKAALDKFVRSVALEIENKVKLISVYPGFINSGFDQKQRTPIYEPKNLFFLYSTPKVKASIILLLVPFSKKRIFIPGLYLLGFLLRFLPDSLYKKILFSRMNNEKK